MSGIFSKPSVPKAPKIKDEDRAGMRAEAERKRRLLLSERRGAKGTIIGGKVGDEKEGPAATASSRWSIIGGKGAGYG